MNREPITGNASMFSVAAFVATNRGRTGPTFSYASVRDTQAERPGWRCD